MIDGITSAYKDFSQKQAEVASHLECLAAEAMQRESSPLEPLPQLGTGPDEVIPHSIPSNLLP